MKSSLRYKDIYMMHLEQEWRREIVKRLDRIDADIKRTMYTMIGTGSFGYLKSRSW